MNRLIVAALMHSVNYHEDKQQIFSTEGWLFVAYNDLNDYHKIAD